MLCGIPPSWRTLQCSVEQGPGARRLFWPADCCRAPGASLALPLGSHLAAFLCPGACVCGHLADDLECAALRCPVVPVSDASRRTRDARVVDRASAYPLDQRSDSPCRPVDLDQPDRLSCLGSVGTQSPTELEHRTGED